ncbi:MAG: corrinoid protein [Verrucomicrobiota bacterium]|jgi:5-methyltetrahydrofolate--homocysteine methyltransferase|nr:corrinoid protein [Verrucomicrobiota bacterium]
MTIKQIQEAVIKGNASGVVKLAQQALDEGAPPSVVLNEGLCAGMGVIGERFKQSEIFVPQVLLAARAMKQGAELLKPHLVAAGVVPFATAVIGTIKGDLHDIGKNLVGMMLEGAGFRVVDAGIGVAPEVFVKLAQEHQAQIIGVSALLTTTMVNMRGVVAAARASGLAVKVIIGGAPVTQAFCDEIGADGYSPDAASAAELATRLVKEPRMHTHDEPQRVRRIL